MFITGLGTATPPRRYTQGECWEALTKAAVFQALQPRSKAILKKVLLGQNGIDTRDLAFNQLEEAFDLTPDALHRRFARTAPELAERASREALSEAGLEPGQIDAVLISTCTGYLCPGLTSYVSERLGLRADIQTADLVGHGCGAALPNLRWADSLIRGGGAERVLTICVEVCSAAFYLDDDPGVLISACLFGDGAAAAVSCVGPNENGPRMEWLDCCGSLSPADRDYLRFETRGGMLRNVLTMQVPGLAAKQAEGALAEIVARHHLRREDIRRWILHAGGRDILTALRARLELREEDVRWSAGVLREHGNLSSPSVLFSLKAALHAGAEPGPWWLCSFGAGFSCYGALLRVG